jgi:hypothetical protein
MELGDFVRETLEQVIEGVRSAQASASTQKAKINPHRVLVRPDQPNARLVAPGSNALIEEIRFDVAVTASQKGEARGGFGVFVAGFVAGGQKAGEAATESASRVQFSVPVVFPLQED